jgi:hypothetical protein
MRLAPSTIGLLVSALSASSAADELAPGFGAAPLADPISSSNFTLASGEFLAQGNNGLYLYAEDGTYLRTITTFVEFGGGLALAVDPSETKVVLSRYEEATFVVDLAGGPATVVSYEVASFIAFEGATSALIATENSLGISLDIRRIDLVTNTTSLLVRGSFGPIARSDDGSLFVVHEQGGGSIMRYSPEQLSSGSILTAQDGAVVLSGLGGSQHVHGLAVAPDRSSLYYSWGGFLGSPRQDLHRFREGDLAPELLLRVEGAKLFTLQWVRGAGTAEFLPFQPAGGGAIVYTLLDGGTARRGALAPERPVASVSGPGTSGSGPFDLTLAGGPPNGTALVFYAPIGSVLSPEPAYMLGVPLFFGLAPGSARRLPGVVPLNVSGGAVLPFVNTTGAPSTWAIQAVLLDADGDLVGSSSLAVL